MLCRRPHHRVGALQHVPGAVPGGEREHDAHRRVDERRLRERADPGVRGGERRRVGGHGRGLRLRVGVRVRQPLLREPAGRAGPAAHGRRAGAERHDEGQGGGVRAEPGRLLRELGQLVRQAHRPRREDRRRRRDPADLLQRQWLTDPTVQKLICCRARKSEVSEEDEIGYIPFVDVAGAG